MAIKEQGVSPQTTEAVSARAPESRTQAAPARIVSVVASARTGCPIELTAASQALGADYDPELLTFALYRLPNSDGRILLYRTGRIVVAGATSVKGAVKALEIMFHNLRSVGHPVSEPEITIENIVAVGSGAQTFDLRELASSKKGSCEFEPEIFPGAIIRNPPARAIVLAFASGRYVITGAKSQLEVDKMAAMTMSFPSRGPAVTNNATRARSGNTESAKEVPGRRRGGKN